MAKHRRTKRAAMSGTGGRPKTAPAADRAALKRPRGRPSLCTPKIIEQICFEIMSGATLEAIARNPEMPGKRTILTWLASAPHEDFRHQYARAREIWAELVGDELLELADGQYVPERNDDGSFVDAPDVILAKSAQDLQRRKVQIAARQWLMSKRAPRRYGDNVRFAGPEPGAGGSAEETVGYVIVPAKRVTEGAVG